MVFCFKRLLPLFVILFSLPAMAQYNTMFTVDNVKVDVTAKNAVAAREEAFNAAQQKAYTELYQRLSDSSYQPAAAGMEVPTPPMEVLSTMIQDYEVTNERLSDVRYIGTYTFRFRPEAVTAYFNNTNVPYQAVQKKTVLVLPFITANGQTKIWDQSNMFMGAWMRQGASLETGSVPIIYPIGDIQDIQDIADANPLKYDITKLSMMKQRYGAGDAMIMIAKEDGRPGGAGLEVTIYEAGMDGAQFVDQLYIQPNQGDPQMAVYDRAVSQIRQMLQQNWKAQTQAIAQAAPFAPNPNGMIRARVRFTSLQEWARIQLMLKQVQGIEGYDILGLSARHALVGLRYKGSVETLRLALQQADMTLGQPSYHYAGGAEDEQNLYKRYRGNPNEEPVYELTPSAYIRF